jgi:hypothetical protein
MSHYCKKDKDPTLSLTHHCLFQLLIQKGFAQQNPPLNNPPIDPQEVAEIPENLQEQQPQNPPDSPEVPNSPPTIPSPPHTLPESSTPALHILSDDFEPDNSPCTIIEEKPPRKRKQIPFFLPFLQRKRTRASTRTATTATALDPQPIRLIPRTPLMSQMPESLSIPPTGTETQEPDAQYVATSSVSKPVAETQEIATHSVAETQDPTTHLVAETQEPTTHSVAETQEPAIAITQEPATAETQEPAAYIVIKTQESDAQGVATLLSLHQEAKTKKSVADPVVAPQEPASEAVTATQEPVTSQLEPTMASVLQENEFLRSELEAYKKELAMENEAYEKELNLNTLARIATMSEGTTTEDPCREYMCSQCGNIYYQAGYKVIKIPMPGASPAPSIVAVKEKHPAVTQEPAGPSKVKTEPWPATNVKTKTLSFVNKVVQTLPIDESTPPSQINTHTFVKQATQTLPQPTICNAETQTKPWDEQAIIEKWKKESVVT